MKQQVVRWWYLFWIYSMERICVNELKRNVHAMGAIRFSSSISTNITRGKRVSSGFLCVCFWESKLQHSLCLVSFAIFATRYVRGSTVAAGETATTTPHSHTNKNTYSFICMFTNPVYLVYCSIHNDKLQIKHFPAKTLRSFLCVCMFGCIRVHRLTFPYAVLSKWVGVQHVCRMCIIHVRMNERGWYDHHRRGEFILFPMHCANNMNFSQGSGLRSPTSVSHTF